jgi:drug/metabolite transporter superfamily protein YnfA
MRWFALFVAAVCGVAFVAFYLLPGRWSEPLPIRLFAGVFIVVTAMVYLWFVEEERPLRVGPWHRGLVGALAGIAVAAIGSGSGELFALLALVGAASGFIGFRWLKHVPL